MKIRAWFTSARFALAFFIMPADLEGIPPKKPSPLWIARRKSMLAFGYDPRDSARP